MVWYKKQHTLERGAKRRYDNAEHKDASSQLAFIQNAKVDGWQTFEDYETGKLIRGIPVETIRRDFQQIVELCRSECKFVRGQWLIPKFGGLQRLQGTAAEQRADTSRSATIDSSEQLRQLQGQSTRLLDQYTRAFVSTPGTDILPDNMPEITANPADQPRAPTPVDVLGSAVTREVLSDGPV